MSTEELLKPRYKVIANMPLLPFKVGEIYDAHFIPVSISGEQHYIRIDIYPHLFKKLEWWEERKESDMPEYLHCVCSDFITFVKGQIISVEKHQSNTFDQYVPWLFISKEKQSSEAMTNCFNYKNFLPATESEYLNQKK